MTPAACCSLSRKVMYIIHSLTGSPHCLGTLNNNNRALTVHILLDHTVWPFLITWPCLNWSSMLRIRPVNEITLKTSYIEKVQC